MPSSSAGSDLNGTSGSSSLRRDSLSRVEAGGTRQLELALIFRIMEKRPGRDRELEALAGRLLRENAAETLARGLRVEWSRRLRSAAGRAEYEAKRVLLNCRLCAFGEAEIERTLRHELAHLLGQARAGHRRIAPHGKEWRRACADLGIADEARCHDLPFPIRRPKRRDLYSCPNCRRDFPRTRPLRRASACLACCRTFNRGRYHEDFKLRLVRR